MEKTDAKRAEEEQPANMRISLAEDWPPPKTTPEALFDHFYADKVRDTFLNQLKEQK